MTLHAASWSAGKIIPHPPSEKNNHLRYVLGPSLEPSPEPPATFTTEPVTSLRIHVAVWTQHQLLHF